MHQKNWQTCLINSKTVISQYYFFKLDYKLDLILNNVECILCKNNNYEIISNSLRYNVPIKVIKCKICSLVSLENPSESGLNYSEDEYREKHTSIIGKNMSPKEMFEYELKFQIPRIQRVKSLITSKSKVLEIGSSTGHFIYSIKDMVDEVAGIELEPKHAKFSKDEKNLNVYDQPLGEAPLKENYFDLIVLFQVLEHIPNPVEFLNLCKKYLKTNGKIYIEVPNIDDVLITAYKIPEFKKFYYRQPHVYYYSTDTLSQLMKLIGFDGKVSTDQEYTIFNHINWMITKNPQLSKDLGYFIPKSIENIDNEKYSNIQEFFKKMDNEYKQLLKKENIAENICYIGKITNLT